MSCRKTPEDGIVKDFARCKKRKNYKRIGTAKISHENIIQEHKSYFIKKGEKKGFCKYQKQINLKRTYKERLKIKISYVNKQVVNVFIQQFLFCHLPSGHK